MNEFILQINSTLGYWLDRCLKVGIDVNADMNADENVDINANINTNVNAMFYIGIWKVARIKENNYLKRTRKRN